MDSVQINLNLDHVSVESLDTAINALGKLREEKDRKRKIRELFNQPCIKLSEIVSYRLLSQGSRRGIERRLKECGVVMYDSPKVVATEQLKSIMSYNEKTILGIR